MDILDRIDAAVGCQHCGGSLGSSPSDDFCSDRCQGDWHAARADELVGYREPWDIPGQGSIEFGAARMRPAPRPEDWRLPVMTSDLRLDTVMLVRAIATATTEDQRAACALRGEQLTERRREAARQLFEAMTPAFRAFSEQMQEAARRVTVALASIKWPQLQQPVPPEAVPASLPEDRAAVARRALEARRNRNTGPRQQRGRPSDYQLAR